MGSVYKKRGKLWIAFFDVDGRRLGRPTDYVPGEEELARKVLKAVEAEVEKGKRVARGVPTVGAFAIEFHAMRLKRKLWSGPKDKGIFKNHIEPTFGQVRLDAVRPLMVRDWVLALRAKDMAPRYVRSVYGLLHTMFEEAVAAEHVDVNPCKLPRGTLPKKKDKDPNWRGGAVFTLAEVQKLISDDRVPADAKVFYALSFLTGARPGELAPRTWEDWDTETRPLGCLRIYSSYRRQNKEVKDTKTEVVRDVPVHPTLAAVLADWKLHGWAEFYGYAPGPKDLIIPNRHGGMINDNTTGDMRKRDLAALGLRYRTTYDARATFLTLGEEAGADDKVLDRVTHSGAATANMKAGYRRYGWAAKCEAVMKLRVHRLGAAVAQLKAVGALPDALPATDSEGQPMTTTTETTVPRARFEGVQTRKRWRSPGVISKYSAEPADPAHAGKEGSGSAVALAKEALAASRRGEPRSEVERLLQKIIDTKN